MRIFTTVTALGFSSLLVTSAFAQDGTGDSGKPAPTSKKKNKNKGGANNAGTTGTGTSKTPRQTADTVEPNDTPARPGAAADHDTGPGSKP
jgi:hypothetical protein